MASVPLKGDTVFAPLNEVIEGLPTAKRAEWERLWMMSDQPSGQIRPLIYPHPVAGKKVNFYIENLFLVLYCILCVDNFPTIGSNETDHKIYLTSCKMFFTLKMETV
jgi:hypothetical protein